MSTPHKLEKLTRRRTGIRRLLGGIGGVLRISRDDMGRKRTEAALRTLSTLRSTHEEIMG